MRSSNDRPLPSCIPRHSPKDVCGGLGIFQTSLMMSDFLACSSRKKHVFFYVLPPLTAPPDHPGPPSPNHRLRISRTSLMMSDFVGFLPSSLRPGHLNTRRSKLLFMGGYSSKQIILINTAILRTVSCRPASHGIRRRMFAGVWESSM